MKAPNLQICYDFSPIETAVQSLSAQNEIAWLTGFDAVAFQKSRPRVECYLGDVTIFGDPPHYHLVGNPPERRINGWRGTLRTVIITPTVSGNAPFGSTQEQIDQSSGQASYSLHWQYRSFVASIMATIDQQLKDNSTLLPYHEISRCWESGTNSKITPQEGVFTSQLNHNLIFNIRADAWPAGLYQPTS